MHAALTRLGRHLKSLTLSLCLGLTLLLTACGDSTTSVLSGDYVEDTVAVSTCFKTRWRCLPTR